MVNNDLMSRIPQDARQQARKMPFPDWIDPMLATLTEDYFSDPDWIFERKLDGERCLAFWNGENLRLQSRNQQSLNNQYPELAAALEEQNQDSFIADGEVVAFKKGVSSFSRLQQRMHLDDPEEARQTGIAVYYYLFDLPYLSGYDLTRVALRDRKSILKQAFSFADPMRYVPHRNQEGEASFEKACQKGWEGIIAKQAQSRYVQSRSDQWLKFKCVNRQEFVIGGFTDPQGSRPGFGALLVGFYQDNDLLYAGKVGTGFDHETLSQLIKRLSNLEQAEPPFVESDLPKKSVHWVEPHLVAQIGFEEWTKNGKLRQPRYQGLRQDKDPRQVIKEEPIS